MARDILIISHALRKRVLPVRTLSVASLKLKLAALRRPAPLAVQPSASYSTTG